MSKRGRADEAIKNFLATVCETSGADPEKVITDMSAEMNRIRKQFKVAPDWTRSSPCSIADLISTKSIGKPRRLRASVVFSSEPYIIYLPDLDGNPERTLVAYFRLRDVAGNEIETIHLTDEALIHNIRANQKRFAELEFLGQVTTVPATAGTHVFRFCVYEVRPVTTALQMVNASGNEVRATKRMLLRLKKEGRTPLSHIHDRIVHGLEIAGLKEHPLLSLALYFTILQALSSGSVGNASGKLNGLIVGAPGSGKKLLNLAARVASIVFWEAHPTKVTPAGLSGSTRLTKDGFISDPGLLPLAHMGTVSIQDAHSIPEKSRAGIYAALSMVMEDGKVMDSTAAKRSYEAETSVLLDLNRHSDLGLQVSNVQSDLGIPLNVLSRFDTVFVFPADAARQAGIALALHAKLGRDNGTRRRLDDEVWVRKIRVLVAYLRDNVQPESSNVSELAKTLHEDLIRDNAGCLALSDFQTRMANSVWKLVRAICRGWNRTVADEEVVREAYRFLASKIDFLRSLDPAIRVPVSWSHETRRGWVRDTFAGVDTTPEEIAVRYKGETGEEISTRTVRRYLEELGVKKPRHGLFRIPPMAKSA